jgi:GNAT superfamily N-acetyltransferase
MSYRAEIGEMLRKMPPGWRRQYAVGRETLARNGGPVLPNAPTPEQAMLILGNSAGRNFDPETPRGDQPVPKAVRDAAMKGLRLSYRNNYGGWEFFGIARAIQLALVPHISLRGRERMVRYLNDHERDKAGTDFGNDAKPSRGYMAWLNWGGDPAKAWNERDGIERATYGASAKRTNGATSAAVKLGAKVGIKGGGKFIPVVGEALMAYDVAREGRNLYRRRRAGEQVGWTEGGVRLAGSAIIGPEGVEWAKKKLDARKAKKNPGSTSAVRTDPELWEEVKAEVTRGSRGGLPGQWSARKAQMSVALYQDRGGGYIGPKSPRNALAKWTREQWRTKSGRPSLETGERYLPAAAIAALTPAEYAATSRAKRAGMRKGEQFVPQPGRIAEKVKRYRRNPDAEAYSHDEGEHGTGEQVVGVLHGELVGNINIYASGAELNRVLKEEEYARFVGLPKGKIGWLGAIELPESSRNRGHGALVVAAMLEEAKGLGVRAVALHADSDASSRFWLREGFTKQPVLPDDHRRGLWMTPMLRRLS